MEANERQLINVNRPYLLDIKCTTVFLNALQSTGILSEGDVDIIVSTQTEKGKTNKMLDILVTRIDGFKALKTALLQDSQTGAAAILQNVNQGCVPRAFNREPPKLREFLSESHQPSLYVLKTGHQSFSVRRLENFLQGPHFIQKQFEINNHLSSLIPGYIGRHNQVHFSVISLKDPFIFPPEWMKRGTYVEEQDIDWHSLSKSEQEKLLNANIKFQNTEMKLRDLGNMYVSASNKHANALFNLIDAESLLQLLNNEVVNLLCRNIPSVPSYYVQRTLVQRSRISRTILGITKSNESEDILMFEGVKNYHLLSLSKRYGNDYCCRSKTQIKARGTERIILLENRADFEVIYEKNKGKPVHLLNCKMKKCSDSEEIVRLEWVKSLGSIELVQKYIHKEQCVISEEELLSRHKSAMRHICISNGAGMGKSLFLANCASKMLNQSTRDNVKYVEYITMRELIIQIKMCTRSSNFPISNSVIIEALANVVSKTSLEREIVRSLLRPQLCNHSQRTVDIELLFDCWDELAPQDISVATEVMKSLIKMFSSGSSCRIWIATRNNKKLEVESLLETLSYSLQAFNDADAALLLKKYWGQSGNGDNGDYDHALKCVQTVRRKLQQEDENVTDIPLFTFLIATIYEGSSRGIYEQNISACDITKTYKYYIQTVLSKKGLDTHECYLGHMQLALQVHFPEISEKFSTFFLLARTVSNDKVLQCGLVKVDGSEFHHTTLSKYFNALIFLTLSKHIYEATTETSIFSGSQLAEILNHLTLKVLSTESVKHKISKISLESEQVDQYLFNHYITCYFLNYSLEPTTMYIPFHVLLGTCDGELTTKNLAKMLWKIYAAAAYKNLEYIFSSAGKALENLLQSCEELKGFFQGKKYKKFDTILYAAAKYGNKNIMKEACDFVQTYSEKSILDFVFHINKTQATLLHVAVEGGNCQAFQHLLSVGQFRPRLNEKIFDNILNFVVAESCEDKLSIVERKEDILKHLFEYRDFKRSTIESLLFKRTHLELLKCVLSELKGGNCKPLTLIRNPDQSDDNILHMLVRNHYCINLNGATFHKTLVMLSEFINLKNHLNVPNINGKRAVDLAVTTIDLTNETLSMFHKFGMEIIQKPIIYCKVMCEAIINQRSVEYLKQMVNILANSHSKCITRKNINSPVGYSENNVQTVLHAAAAHLNYDATEYFIEEFGINANVQDEDGNTPLHLLLQTKNMHIYDIFKTQFISLVLNKAAKVDLSFALDPNVTMEKFTVKAVDHRGIHSSKNDNILCFQMNDKAGNRYEINCSGSLDDDKKLTFKISVFHVDTEGLWHDVALYDSEKCEPDSTTVCTFSETATAANKHYKIHCKFLNALENGCSVSIVSNQMQHQYEMNVTKSSQQNLYNLHIKKIGENGNKICAELVLLPESQNMFTIKFAARKNPYNKSLSHSDVQAKYSKASASQKLTTKRLDKTRKHPNMSGSSDTSTDESDVGNGKSATVKKTVQFPATRPLQKRKNHEEEPDNQHRIATILINNGARIDFPNHIGLTPFHNAIDLCLLGLDEVESYKLQAFAPYIFSLPNILKLALKGLLLNPYWGSCWHPSIFITFADELMKLWVNLDCTLDEDCANLLDLTAKAHCLHAVEYLSQNEVFCLHYEKNLTEIKRGALRYMKCVNECKISNCEDIKMCLRN